MGTKNKFAQYSADRNYRKFALLGDPAIRFAVPDLSKNRFFCKDTVNALSEVKVWAFRRQNGG